MVVDAVSCGPVSSGVFPDEQGKYREIRRFWPVQPVFCAELIFNIRGLARNSLLGETGNLKFVNREFQFRDQAISRAIQANGFRHHHLRHKTALAPQRVPAHRARQDAPPFAGL